MLGSIDGKLAPIPFNLDSLDILFSHSEAQALSRQLLESYGMEKKVPILKMREAQSGDLRDLADYIYEKVFLHYTLKQWDLRPEDLDPSVSARVPVHISRDPRYFQDVYQAMPEQGYSALFSRMLDHPNIHVSTNTSYGDIRREQKSAKVIFTGPVDEFFDYAYGALPYRSLRFQLASTSTCTRSAAGWYCQLSQRFRVHPHHGIQAPDRPGPRTAR